MSVEKKKIEKRRNYELVSADVQDYNVHPIPAQRSIAMCKNVFSSPRSQFSASTHQPSHVNHYLSFFTRLTLFER